MMNIKKMKRIGFVWLFAILAAAFSATPVFSQDAAGPVDNSDFYTLQVPIEKIYATPTGYYVEYRRNTLGRNSVILPRNWFKRTADNTAPLKGEMVRINGRTGGPYMIIYYKAGKTDHVRLYVREDNHNTWGKTAPSNANFDNVDDIEDIVIVR
ncbi:MAG: hypothetical protein LBK66_10180 [Spirochaetaceae bacterium]|jgi:hypothetical protein|nr:hypothetical protein [Spirochaetaceae bacterium]